MKRWGLRADGATPRVHGFTQTAPSAIDVTLRECLEQGRSWITGG